MKTIAAMAAIGIVSTGACQHDAANDRVALIADTYDGNAAAFVPYSIAGQRRFSLQVALYENNFHHSTRVLVGSRGIIVEY